MASNLPERVSFEPARGKHILIALSGGADSVALLMLMARAREKYAMRVTAAHLNHMIRGSDADGDQRFCEELCFSAEKRLRIIRKTSIIDYYDGGFCHGIESAGAHVL